MSILNKIKWKIFFDSAEWTYIDKIYRKNQELLWAKIWDDTKNGIEWIKELPSISSRSTETLCPQRSFVLFPYR